MPTPSKNSPAAAKAPAPSRAAQILRKAKDAGEWLACYDANGKLMGIVDPDDVTPVSDGAADAAQQPKPTASAQTEAAAGEDPTMGVAKRAREHSRLKKGLYGGGTAGEQAELAEQLNEAAIVALDVIQGRRPPVQPTRRR
jgi:hypothetical protein